MIPLLNPTKKKKKIETLPESGSLYFSLSPFKKVKETFVLLL